MSEQSGVYFGWNLPGAEERLMPGAVSFGVESGSAAGPSQGGPSWQMRLPADPEQAELAVSLAENEAMALQARLERAGLNADSLAYQAIANSEAEPGTLSFGLLDRTDNHLLRELQEWLRGLTRMITQLAWVETSTEGQVLGRTVVGWRGDLGSTYALGLTPEQIDLHRRSLSVALLSRISLVRAAALILQTATRAAIIAAAPAGALWALPGAWKAVQQLINEIGDYQSGLPKQPNKEKKNGK